MRAYLTHCRVQARTTIGGLMEEGARRVCRWGCLDLTFAELLLYGMRHVQHHAGQLNLLLRQSVGAEPLWVKRMPCELPSTVGRGLATALAVCSSQ